MLYVGVGKAGGGGVVAAETGGVAGVKWVWH